MDTNQLGIQVDTAEPAYLQIEKRIETLITTGRLAFGARLPTTRDLARQAGVDCKPVQQALNRLKKRGLIDRTPRRGTFVRAAAAKATIGLLFGPTLADEGAHFYRAMLRAFRAELEDRDQACRVYDGLTGTTGIPLPADAETYRQLDADLRNHRFTGLVEFAVSLQGDWHRQTPLPHVCYGPTRADGRTALLDYGRFGREAVEFLAQGGRRRIVCLVPSAEDRPAPDLDTMLSGAMAAARELGLPPPVCVPRSVGRLTQGAGFERDVFQTAMTMVAGWARMPASERPDALLSADDIVTRAVSLALIHSGVRVPEELTVLTLTNEGVDLHYGIPVVRYEFASRALAHELVGLLWNRMQGESQPTLPIMIPGKIVEDGK